MKDALVQAALSYKNLLDTEYEFRFGISSRKMVITLISSTKGEFLHTIGLHHLKIYLISTNLNILGINDRYTVITSDGWIMTNIMEWRYSFFIGSDAVRKISETVISDMQ